MAKRINQCEVVNERVAAGVDSIFEAGLPLDFTLACGQSYVAYESLFCNTRVTGTLVLEADLDNDCTLTVTVEREGQAPIVRTITPTDPNRSISLIADSLTRITFSCGTDQATGVCEGEYTLLLHWCKCC